MLSPTPENIPSSNLPWALFTFHSLLPLSPHVPPFFLFPRQLSAVKCPPLFLPRNNILIFLPLSKRIALPRCSVLSEPLLPRLGYAVFQCEFFLYSLPGSHPNRTFPGFQLRILHTNVFSAHSQSQSCPFSNIINHFSRTSPSPVPPLVKVGSYRLTTFPHLFQIYPLKILSPSTPVCTFNFSTHFYTNFFLNQKTQFFPCFTSPTLPNVCGSALQ